MGKREAVEYWADNLLYAKIISDVPHLQVLLPLLKVLSRTPLWRVFEYFKLDYKIFSIQFDYANDALRDIIISKHKDGKAIQADEIYFLCTKGWRKIITFSFLGKHNYPFYIWKTLKDSKVERRLNNESHLLEKISLLDNSISRVVPQVKYKGFIDGKLAVLQSAKEGDLLVKSLLACKNSLNEFDDIFSIIRDWLILLHTKSRTVEKSGGYPRLRDITSDALRLYKENTFLTEDELQGIHNFLDKEICKIENLPFPFVIQHGDFQAENILYNKVNREIAVFDWEYALEKGLPLIDLLVLLCSSLSFILKSKKANARSFLHLIPRFTSIRYNINVDIFTHIFYKSNDISDLVKKHVDIYCKELMLEKKLINLLFFIFITQYLSHDNSFLNIFLSRKDNVLL